MTRKAAFQKAIAHSWQRDTVRVAVRIRARVSGIVTVTVTVRFGKYTSSVFG